MSGFLPSFGQGKALVVTGAYAALGWIGTNAVMMLLDKIGVASLKAKVTDPKMMAGVNLVERTLAAFVATKLLGRFARGQENAVRIGAAANVGLHTAADVVQAFGVALPSWGAPLLLGYSGGMGGYVTQATLARRVTPGMHGLRGYITAGTAMRNNGPGSMLNSGYASAFPVPSY